VPVNTAAAGAGRQRAEHERGARQELAAVHVLPLQARLSPEGRHEEAQGQPQVRHA